MSRARWMATPWMLLIGLSLAVGCRERPRPSAQAGSPLEFVPQSAAFELPFGGETTEDFRLVGATASGTVSVVSGGDPDLRIEPLAGERGLGAGLRIHASGRQAGVRVGTLLVATGPSGSRPLPLLFSLRVRGTLRITPTNPLIDLSRPGAKATVIDVGSTQPDFVVTAAEIEVGPFAASFERAAPGGTFRVSVTALTARMVTGARGAVGTLVVRSNDAAEPRKEIPLFAFGNSDAVVDASAGQ